MTTGRRNRPPITTGSWQCAGRRIDRSRRVRPRRSDELPNRVPTVRATVPSKLSTGPLTVGAAGSEDQPPWLIINLSHPLTDRQREDIVRLSGRPIGEVRHHPVHFDDAAGYVLQVRQFVDAIALTSEEWQTRPIALVPPAYSPITCVVLAEIHGRAGFFLPIVRIRSVPDQIPVTFDVAELLDLQAVRQSARRHRQAGHDDPAS